MPSAWRHRLLIAFSFWFSWSGAGRVEDLSAATAGMPEDVSARVEVESVQRRSGQARPGSVVRSVGTVRLTNTGDRPIKPPFHVVVRFAPVAGTGTGGSGLAPEEPAGVVVEGGRGGPGAEPYGAWYLDVSSGVGARGLGSGETFDVPLAFTRPSTLRAGYRIEVHGVLNQAPVASPGGPYRARVGEEIVFDAGASSDPEGAPLAFRWRFGDGASRPGDLVRHAYSRPGLYEARLEVEDPDGGRTTARVLVTVLGEGDFALGRTRTLDAAGLPLPGVAILERSAVGAGVEFASDPVSGFASLGSAVAGRHEWKFSRPGYLPVWRVAELADDEVAVVPNPWLTPTADEGERVVVSPIEAAVVASPGGGVAIAYAAGAFSQPGEAAVVELGPQSLPFPLPAGWRPVQAFHVALDEAPLLPGDGSVLPWETVPAGTAVVAARLAGTSEMEGPPGVRWMVDGADVTLVGGRLRLALEEPGFHVLVVADGGDTAPPAPVAGEALEGTNRNGIDLDRILADGSVHPALAAASTRPEDVTALGQVDFMNPGLLPSGAWFRTEVEEDYRLRDGRRVRAPVYDTTVFAFRPLAVPNANRATAFFPLRPQLLLGSDSLQSGLVRADVLGPGEFPGAIVGPDGGAVAMGGVRVELPAGAVSRASAAEIRILDVDGFDGVFPGIDETAQAFEFNVGHLVPGSRLGVFFEGLAPDTDYVLGRIVLGGGDFGIEPLERIRTSSDGTPASVEPDGPGERLPGMAGSGQFVLVRVSGDAALVQGTARDASGNVAEGLGARVEGQPWLSVSRPGGGFALLAPTGSSTLVLLDPATGDEGTLELDVTDPSVVIVADLAAAPAGPRVVSTDPEAGATGVRVVTPITVRFSEPIHPASFAAAAGAALSLLDPDGQPVPSSVSLETSGRRATLLPANPLAFATGYRLVISPDLTDLGGLPLEGANEFSFVTVPPGARGEGAQLVIFEPDAENVPQEILDQLVGYDPDLQESMVVAAGSAGTADGEVPVILVNETTGETATVLSKVDGSFANFLRAAEEDFISAVFVNENGTRITIPASRQQFDDGSVGLYRQGGILEAESDGGPVQVFVEPEAVPLRNKFKLDVVSVADLLVQLQGALPEEGILLGGLRLSSEGDDLLAPVDVALPVDPAQLDLSDGSTPEEARFTVAAIEEIDGVTVYNVLDSARWVDGQVRTESPPFTGVSLGGGVLMQLALFQIPSVAAVITGKVIVVPEGTPPADFAGTAGLAFRGVAGAVVTAGPQVNAPGLIRGAFISRANSNGGFTIQVPVQGELDPVAMRATSIRFPGRAAVGVATSLRGFRAAGGEVRTVNLPFLIPAGAQSDDNRAPQAFLQQPSASLPVGEEVTIHLNLVDDLGAPSISNSDWLRTGDDVFSFALGSGAPLVDEDVDFLQGATTVTGNTTARTEFRITVGKAALFFLTATVTDDAGNEQEYRFSLVFREPPGPALDDLQPSDPDDETPPRVVSVNPGGGATVSSLSRVVVTFSEAVQNSIEDGVGITVSGSVSGSVPFEVKPFSDQTGAEILLAGVQPGETVNLHFGSAIVDLAGNGLESHGDTVRTAATVVLDSGVASTAMAAEMGAFTILVGRDTNAETLRVFRTSDGGQLQLDAVGSLGLPAYPRALAVTPRFAFRRTPDGPVMERPLAIVAGGLVGLDQAGQWLWVVDLEDPENPVRIASAIASIDFASVINKAVVRDGMIFLQNISPDFSAIQQISLQGFILGSNLQINQFAPNGASQPGTDLNGDGDFVDAGEILPKPSRNELWGLRATVPLAEGRIIRDFDVYLGGAFVGAVLPAVADGPARFQSVISLGQFIGEGAANDTSGAVDFPGAGQMRVAYVPDVVVPAVAQPLPVAAIVTVDRTVHVIDVTTDPFQPKVVLTMPLPDGTGNIMFLEATSGGFAAATNRFTHFFDKRLLTVPMESTSDVHPALTRIVAAGSVGRTLGLSETAVAGLQEGTVRRILLPPPIEFLRLPSVPVFDATALAGMTDTQKRDLLDQGVIEEFLVPSRLTEQGPGFPGALSDPPPPGEHHYVVVRAPGELGETLSLGIDAADRRGRRRAPRGEIAPPVLLSDLAGNAGVADFQPTVEAHEAKRLSADPFSPFYNLYLSQPLLVSADAVSPEIMSEVASLAGRQLLHVGEYVRAWIESADNGLLAGDWRATSPGSGDVPPDGLVGLAPAFCAEFIDSSNPTPRQASPQVQGVALQSGEFRYTARDLLVEGRGLDMVLTRTYESHTRFVGPFGRGWDSNLFRRLCEIPIGLVPGDLRIPVTIFGDPARDQVARPGDILLQTGDGDILLYRRITPDAGNFDLMSAFTSDPAIAHFGWSGKIASYFQPPPGIFELFVRFTDGTYASIDQEASMAFYDAEGRLTRVQAAYSEAAMSFTYRADGRLHRVEGDRGISFEFGYYGKTTDGDFVNGVDKPYPGQPQLGLVARVRAGTQDAEYHYDDNANLLRVEDVNSPNVQVYGYEQEAPYLIRTIGRGDGSLSPSQTLTYDQGAVISTVVDGQTYGFAGAVAEARERAAQQAGSVSVTVAGATRDFPIDARGAPTSYAGLPVIIGESFLIECVGEGARAMETEYESGNNVYRFRGNPCNVKRGELDAVIAYDGSVWNRIESVTTPEGVVTTWSYADDDDGPGEAITMTTGPVSTVLALNAWGQVLSERVTEAGVTLSRTTVLDGDGLPSSVRIGSETVATVSRGSQGGISNVGDAGGGATPQFDGEGRLEHVEAAGATVTFGYDAQTGATTSASIEGASGTVTETITPGTDPSGTAGFSITESGLPVVGGTYQYDGAGQVTGMSYGGDSVAIGYDGVQANSLTSADEVVSVTYQGADPDQITENGVASTVSFDTLGRIQSIIGGGGTKTFTYGAGRRLTGSKLVDPQFGTLVDETYGYDGAGRVDSVTDADVTKRYSYFPDGSVRRVEFDGCEQLALERDDAGRVTRDSLYGGFVEVTYGDFEPVAGQARSETLNLAGGSSVQTQRTYDGRGLLLTESVGGLAPHVLTWDDFGNQTGHTDPDGVTMSETHSPSGAPLTRTFGDGTTVNFGYDAARRITSVGALQIGRAADGSVTSLEFPDGSTVALGDYNAFLEAETVTLGDITQLHGYTHGRRTSIEVPATGDELTMEYDALGRMRRMERDGLVGEFEYEPHFGAVRESGPLGDWSVTLGTCGFVQTEGYPSGISWGWSPNVAGLMTVHPEAGATAIDWVDADVLASVDYGEVAMEREFDAAGRPFRVSWTVDGALVAGWEWTLTAGGRVASVQALHDGRFDVFHRNGSDAGMRVVAADFGAENDSGAGAVGSIAGIDYDAASEIDWSGAAGAGASERTVVPGPGDALMPDGGGRGVAVEGPIWVDSGGGPVRAAARFEYDGFNQLRRVERLDGLGAVVVTVTYLRDGQGRIAERLVEGDPALCVPGRWRYAWNDDRLLEEYEVVGGQDLLVRRHLYAADELIGLQSAATPGGVPDLYIPLVDFNGSVGGYLDADGNIREIIRYGLFGLPDIQAGGGAVGRTGVGGMSHFHGAFFDADVGLYDMGTRTLHPVFGRFLQRDREVYESSPSLYLAFGGDPASNVDRDGAAASNGVLGRAAGWWRSIEGGVVRGGFAASDARSIPGPQGTSWKLKKNSKALGMLSGVLNLAAERYPPETGEHAVLSKAGKAAGVAKYAVEIIEAQSKVRSATRLLAASDQALSALEIKRTDILNRPLATFFNNKFKTPAQAKTFARRFGDDALFNARVKTRRNALARVDAKLAPARKRWAQHSLELRKERISAAKTGVGIARKVFSAAFKPTAGEAEWFTYADTAFGITGHLLDGADLVTRQTLGKITSNAEVSILGGYAKGRASSLAMRGVFVMRGADIGFQIGFEGASRVGIPFGLRHLVGEDVASEYQATVKQFHADGGFLTTFGGALSHWFGLDRTAHLIQRYHDFSFVGSVVESRAEGDRRNEAYIRNAAAP